MANPKTYLTHRLFTQGAKSAIWVPFDSKKAASNYRLRLYAFRRAQLKLVDCDPDLKNALDIVEVVLREIEGKWHVGIRPEWENESLLAIAQAMGIPLDKDYEAHASQERLLERLKESDKPKNLAQVIRALEAEMSGKKEGYSPENFEENLSIYDEIGGEKNV